MLCFVNLQKKMSDSVDRGLLGTVLMRYGVSPWMISVSRQFQGGMQARMPIDAGEYSEWFGARQ